jgi:hypothetical protein
MKNKKNEQLEDTRLNGFMHELEALSQKHQIGICGAASLFVMETDDFERSYKFNETGGLRFD